MPDNRKGHVGMRLGLLTQWYDPEPGPAALPGVLARGLQARGHEVRVLTGFPNYPTGKIAPGYRITSRARETLQGVDVRRVALYPNHDRSTVRRLANYASFGASATLLGMGALRGLDAIWVNYSPITVAWPMWAARGMFGVPSVVHVLDLWPDTVAAGGFGSERRGYRMATHPLHLWCKAMYASARSVAYISPGVGALLQARGVPAEKLHYVPMWADESIFFPQPRDMRAELGLSPEAIVLLYAGSLGDAQGLETLIEACRSVLDPRFVALIAGSGIAESALREQAADVPNVRFLGRVDSDRMTELMATGDLNYVSLRSHPLSAYTMPSKTQAALASGRALVVVADGDVIDVALSSKAAWTAGPGDVAAIVEALAAACRTGRSGLAEMGRKARAFYEQTFSVERGVDQLEALLIQASHHRERIEETA